MGKQALRSNTALIGKEQMFEILQYTFVRNALIAAVLVNIICGIVGTYVVIKRIVLIG